MVLDNISFEAKESEILGFLGPNGAGKTTTMKIITGSLIPDSGSVTIDGLDVMENVMEIKNKVGYLAEHNPLYYDMFVKEFLLFIASIHKIPNKKSRVNEIIELTGLQKEKNKKLNQLSKGYKQRVGLAQVLLNDPKVLILDEPTTGLDPNQLKEIRTLVKSMGKDKTVIFSTHIMQEVQAMCDRVIILNEGKIVADGSIDTLSEFATQEIKTVFVEFENKIDEKKLTDIDSVKEVEALPNNFYKLSGYDDLAIRRDVFLFAKERGHIVLSLHKEDINVENIFELLTHK